MTQTSLQRVLEHAGQTTRESTNDMDVDDQEADQKDKQIFLDLVGSTVGNIFLERNPGVKKSQLDAILEATAKQQ